MQSFFLGNYCALIDSSFFSNLYQNNNKSSDDDEYANVDWDSLGFGLMPTDFMYVTKCSAGQNFGHGQLNRYGNIELSPSAGVLNYGQV